MRARTKNPSSWGTALEPVSQGPAARGPQPSRSGTTMKSFDLDLESICSRVKKDRKKWDGSEAIHP